LTPAHTAADGASGSNTAVIAPSVGVPLVQDAVSAPSQGYSEVGDSLEIRKSLWRLEHVGIQGCTNATYWAQRAASRDLL
jgi:hypothetical protein